MIVWLELMMACHHATGGAGGDVFAIWSAGDPEYADHLNQNLARWKRFGCSFERWRYRTNTIQNTWRMQRFAHLVEPDADEASDDFDGIDPLDEQTSSPCYKRKRQ